MLFFSFLIYHCSEYLNIASGGQRRRFATFSSAVCLFSTLVAAKQTPLPPSPTPPKRRKPQSAINTIMINYGAQLQFTHLPNCNSSLALCKKCERAENPPHLPLPFLFFPQLFHFPSARPHPSSHTTVDALAPNVSCGLNRKCSAAVDQAASHCHV